MCPRVPKRDKIELLGCLLVSLGGSEGDRGAPKWCFGCPWGGQNGVLGALGAPLGHPWATLGSLWSKKLRGIDLLGHHLGSIFDHFWTTFVFFLRLCFGCGFRYGFGTHFKRKKENPSHAKKAHLVIHIVKHRGIDIFCLVMSCLVLSSCLVLCDESVSKKCPKTNRK